jgi:cell fate regulator YaaT (PSP1 superfamily)
MACGNCSSGGCGTTPAGCQSNGNCGTGGCNKLDVFDWLAGMQRPGTAETEFVEIRFKNTRKEFFKNSENLSLVVGEMVAVEATTGHDLGMVSLTGELVRFQMRKNNIKENNREIKKIYRKATESDIEKWKEAREMEHDTMIKTRKIVRDLKLHMKISDVEFQGDKNKATFYYIADERVDFRELIKILAEQFRTRVEMRQIGSRQEAGMVGGIGSCGRELCCSSWLTDFRTVSTAAARYQQLSINPMKLAGQCGKLKCCLNYELDSYMDAIKQIPDHRTKLKTKRGMAFHQKTDIFKGMMWFSYEDAPSEFIPMQVDRVKEVMAFNKEGKEVDDLVLFTFREEVKEQEVSFGDVIGQEDLTRFDKKKGEANKPRNRKKGGGKGVTRDQKPGQKPAQKADNRQGKPKAQDNKPKPESKPNLEAKRANPAADAKGDGAPKKKRPNRNFKNRNKGNKPNTGDAPKQP